MAPQKIRLQRELGAKGEGRGGTVGGGTRGTRGGKKGNKKSSPRDPLSHANFQDILFNRNKQKIEAKNKEIKLRTGESSS